MAASISITPSRKIISVAEINTHFTTEKNLHWIKFKDLFNTISEQCVDGRSTKDIIGTPGGNMGELILSLDAAEKVAGVILRDKEVESLFAYYVAHFGTFYMHTDMHGLHHLLHDKAVKKAGIKAESEIEAFVKNPPKAIQPKLLTLLTTPDNIGCGHLKLMLLHPDEFGVRPSLIKTAMKAFYQALWQGQKLNFVILNAEHQEGAIVTVLIEAKNFTENTEIPTIASMGAKHQMFVNHPQAINWMREQIAAEIISKKLIYGLTKKQLKQYTETIVERGNHLTRLTLSYLALGLPHYTVTVNK